MFPARRPIPQEVIRFNFDWTGFHVVCSFAAYLNSLQDKSGSVIARYQQYIDKKRQHVESR